MEQLKLVYFTGPTAAVFTFNDKVSLQLGTDVQDVPPNFLFDGIRDGDISNKVANLILADYLKNITGDTFTVYRNIAVYLIHVGCGLVFEVGDVVKLVVGGSSFILSGIKVLDALIEGCLPNTYVEQVLISVVHDLYSANEDIRHAIDRLTASTPPGLR